MYITTYTNPIKKQQIQTSYLSLLKGTTNDIMDTVNLEDLTFKKVTFKIQNPKPYTQLSAKQRNDLVAMVGATHAVYNTFYPYYNSVDLKKMYYEFKIPKASGGLRTIHAPNEELKTDLYRIKDLFEKIYKCLPHDNAYAYVKNRDTKQELELHRVNDSKWFLKIDLKDFFPSCTSELIIDKLKNLYPFYYFDLDTLTKLSKIIDICLLDNCLPQGTPTSPLLTNLIMVSYDYEITEYLKQKGAGYIYTRYADDILISNKGKFNWKEILADMYGILKPFTIKTEKTRFGSSNGRNWNLGLMYNKDNQITLGYRKKQLLNAMLNNFLRDASKQQYWSREDTYHLIGQLSYLKHIEPDYSSYIITKYETKHRVSLGKVIKDILNPRV